MAEAAPRAYRYERKFLVEELDARQVRALVARHPGMFVQPYPPRYVNNLYLDSEDLDNYHANVAGMADRHKVRVRWYGAQLFQVQDPVLELKVKRGLVGTKYSYRFPGFRIAPGFCHADLQRMVRAADLPADVRDHLHGLGAVLCNRYYRWYYASRDGRYRLTVDSGLEYLRVKRAANRFLSRWVDHAHVVVELKYDLHLDPQADRVAAFFPFSVTRNSKYVTGIEATYL